jgi:hypothetical protein
MLKLGTICMSVDGCARSNEHSICGVLTGVRNSGLKHSLTRGNNRLTIRVLHHRLTSGFSDWSSIGSSREQKIQCGVFKVLKMEAACSSETLSIIYRDVSCHKPENCRTNLKSHTENKDPLHVTKRYEWREAHFHSFVSSHKRSEWSDSQSGRFILGKRLQGTQCSTGSLSVVVEKITCLVEKRMLTPRSPSQPLAY